MRTTKFTEATCHHPSKQIARDMIFNHQMDYINSFDESSPRFFNVPCLPWLEGRHELKLAKHVSKKEHVFHFQGKENCKKTWRVMEEKFFKGEHWIQKFSKRAKYENGVFFAAKGNVQIQLEKDDWTWEDVANNPLMGWGDFCGMPLKNLTNDFFQNAKPRSSYALTFYLDFRNSYPESYDSRLTRGGYHPIREREERHSILFNFLKESMPLEIKRSESIYYMNSKSPMGTYYIETN